MLYSTPDAPVRKEINTRTQSKNEHQYESPNARLRLNSNGRPVAIRRVIALGQPGSFARKRYEAVIPDKVVSLSHVSLTAWEEKRSNPVN